MHQSAHQQLLKRDRFASDGSNVVGEVRQNTLIRSRPHRQVVCCILDTFCTSKVGEFQARLVSCSWKMRPLSRRHHVSCECWSSGRSGSNLSPFCVNWAVKIRHGRIAPASNWLVSYLASFKFTLEVSAMGFSFAFPVISLQQFPFQTPLILILISVEFIYIYKINNRRTRGPLILSEVQKNTQM